MCSWLPNSVSKKKVSGEIIIFTDGASKGNPGPGGWGAVLKTADTVIELGGANPSTTNNRMEMEAALQALRQIQPAPSPVILLTDSTYMIKGITQWIHGWRKKGWKTSQGGDVLNRDLWEELDRLAKGTGKPIDWRYVRGHVGIAGNERVDTIASELALGNHVDLYRGPTESYTVDLTPPHPSASKASGSSRSASAQRSPSGKGRKAYSYLSLVGGVAKRHSNWADCERRVKGVSGARFKKAMSAEDEGSILDGWGASLPRS